MGSNVNICDHGVKTNITPCPLCLMTEIDELKSTIAALTTRIGELDQLTNDYIVRIGALEGTNDFYKKRITALTAEVETARGLLGRYRRAHQSKRLDELGTVEVYRIKQETKKTPDCRCKICKDAAAALAERGKGEQDDDS